MDTQSTVQCAARDYGMLDALSSADAAAAPPYTAQSHGQRVIAAQPALPRRWHLYAPRSARRRATAQCLSAARLKTASQKSKYEIFITVRTY